ncbi:DUF2156 domain-containing protein [bacterium]|nr:DUF2156 domain-containing protein [bacterium]
MVNKEKKYELITKYSYDPNAYALLQNDMNYFVEQNGFIGYRELKNNPVVLDDPIVASENLESLVRSFYSKEPNAIYVNISQEFASKLYGYDLGYRFCPYGTENVLDLDPALLDGKKVKSALKKAKKATLSIEEVDFDDLDQQRLDLMKTINMEFLENTPSKKEITFISRAVEFRNQPGVRFFALKHVDKGEEKCFGFIVLDPFFKNGQKVGYQLNAIRFRRTKIWGVYYSIVGILVEKLMKENYKKLSLGGLALDMFETPSPFPHDSKMVNRIISLGKKADNYYVVSNFTDMKLEFAGERIRRYIAIPEKESVSRSIFRFLRVSGIL